MNQFALGLVVLEKDQFDEVGGDVDYSHQAKCHSGKEVLAAVICQSRTYTGTEITEASPQAFELHKRFTSEVSLYGALMRRWHLRHAGAAAQDRLSVKVLPKMTYSTELYIWRSFNLVLKTTPSYQIPSF